MNNHTHQFFLYDNNWKVLEKNEKNHILKQVKKTLTIRRLNNQALTKHPIPFYPQLTLIRYQPTEEGSPIELKFLLFNPEKQECYYLNGSSNVIHQINKDGFLSLSEENIFEYLRFFCFFVHGEDGPFTIVDSISDSCLAGLSNRSIKLLNKHVFPIEFQGKNDHGQYPVNAGVLYANHYFKAEFLVHDSGFVQMTNDKHLCKLPSSSVKKNKHARSTKNTDLVKFLDINELLAAERYSADQENAKKVYQRYVAELAPTAGFLPLGQVKFSEKQVAKVFATLRLRHPHFSEVTDYFENLVTLSVLLDSGRIRFQPILLEGPPGIGKTLYIQDLSQALSIPMSRIDCGNVSASWVIAGASSSWCSGKPGVVVDTILLYKCSSPIIALDEIDKISTTSNYSASDCLYSLLEPVTSKTFKDEFLNVMTDCSQINWIATANDFARIPVALQSRFRRFQVTHPNEEHMNKVIRSVYTDLVSQNNWGFAFTAKLKEDIVSHIASSSMPPRVVRRVLMEACTRAAIRYKYSKKLLKGISLNIEDVVLVDVVRERSIGFIH